MRFSSDIWIHHSQRDYTWLLTFKEIDLSLIVRSHSLDFDIKLGFNFKIESCEDINDFILCEYNFDSHIVSKIICENDKIAALILWDRKQITYVRMNKIKRLLWLNSSLSEYLLFHLLFLNTELINWFWLLFYLLHEFMKFNSQSYSLNILDIINIKIV